jgi:hypothetical protein
MKNLFESIIEAATSLRDNTKTMCDEEVADMLSEVELSEMDTALWEMVELTQ